MAIYKLIPNDAARMCSILFIPKPLSTTQRKFTRGAGLAHQNRSPSFENLPSGGFSNPLVNENGKWIKLRFFDQANHIAYSIKHFYEDFVGNREVQESQSKVKDLQPKLSVLIDNRNGCEFALIEVKKQLTEVNSSQQSVSREDVQYIDLLKQEFKLFSEKQRLESMIEVQTYEHQFLLMQLTYALNDVHVKERQEASNIRLVKLFFTTLAAILGFAGTVGYNHYKDSKVQSFMTSQSKMMKTLVEYVEQEQARNGTPTTESWGSYLYRQPGRLYGYLFSNQSNGADSWSSSLYRQPVRLYLSGTCSAKNRDSCSP